MRRFDLSSVLNCEMVFSHGDYVVLSGKKTWIFRKDGTFISKLKTVRNAYEMVFLPGNMVLMDGGGGGTYHYVSLENGEIIWSCAKKGRRDILLDKFAVSPNRKVIYHVYYNKGMLYADHIEPEKQLCSTYMIPNSYGGTHHCYCDNPGKLSMLKTYWIDDVREGGADNSYQSNGILTWSPGSMEAVWKCQWRTSDIKNTDGTPFIACMCNDDYLLSRDLTVFSFETGNTFSLLENSPKLKRAPGGIDVMAFDPERKLLTVRFLYSFSSIIIDCNERKVVAHYAPTSPDFSGGCLIGNEFWIGTRDGVIKRPFPHMDKFPRLL